MLCYYAIMLKKQQQPLKGWLSLEPKVDDGYAVKFLFEFMTVKHIRWW